MNPSQPACGSGSRSLTEAADLGIKFSTFGALKKLLSISADLETLIRHTYGSVAFPFCPCPHRDSAIALGAAGQQSTTLRVGSASEKKRAC